MVIPSTPFWVHYCSTDTTFDALWACVPLYITLNVQLCPMFSIDPSVVGLANPWTCWRKDTITRWCTSHTCVTWSAKSLSFVPSCEIKLFELGVEVVFNNLNASAVTHHKVNLLKFPLWSSWSEHTDDAFVLLNCFCLGTPRPCLSTVQILKYIQSAEPHWLRPHLFACPKDDLRRNTLDRSCTESPDFFWLVLSPLYPVPSPPDLPCCRFKSS